MINHRINHDDEHRVSSLPDELLVMILDRMDARTAMTTTALSKRWCHLPRQYTEYSFDVYDMLPPQYHRLKSLWAEIMAWYEEKAEKLTEMDAMRERSECWMPRTRSLTTTLQRFVRRAMRRYAKRVGAFLLDTQSRRSQCRSIQKLRLRDVGVLFWSEVYGCLGKCLHCSLEGRGL